MSLRMQMSGTRLAYVVRELEGNLIRPRTTWSKDRGLETKHEEVPAGFMVYFPRGHVLRIPDAAMLKHYKLNREAPIVNLAGLNDPRSPIGKLFMSQDDKSRKQAFDTLEKQVIDLATAKTGPIIMPEQVSGYEEPEVGSVVEREED